MGLTKLAKRSLLTAISVIEVLAHPGLPTYSGFDGEQMLPDIEGPDDLWPPEPEVEPPSIAGAQSELISTQQWGLRLPSGEIAWGPGKGWPSTTRWIGCAWWPPCKRLLPIWALPKVSRLRRFCVSMDGQPAPSWPRWSIRRPGPFPLLTLQFLPFPKKTIMTSKIAPPTPMLQPTIIPIEVFARDLWEAMREEAREQLDGAITDEVFDSQIPAWEQLSEAARQAKILVARDELLKVLDRAGYQVRTKKKKETP